MTTTETKKIDVKEMTETFDECEREIYNLLSKFKKRISKATESSNSFKRYLIMADRGNFASEVLVLLNDFLQNVNYALDYTLEKIEENAVAHSRLSDRFSILWQIRVLLNDTKNENKIQEELTNHFGNEHTWKKELPEEFLRILASYEETPSQDKRDNLLYRLSTLTSITINRGSYNCTDEYKEFSSDYLRKERERLHKDVHQLMQLNARGGKLKHFLLKLHANI